MTCDVYEFPPYFADVGPIVFTVPEVDSKIGAYVKDAGSRMCNVSTKKSGGRSEHRTREFSRSGSDSAV